MDNNYDYLNYQSPQYDELGRIVGFGDQSIAGQSATPLSSVDQQNIRYTSLQNPTTPSFKSFQNVIDQQKQFERLINILNKLWSSRNRSKNQVFGIKTEDGMPIRFTGEWNDLVNEATRIAEQYGIPPAAMVGQMALETGRGTSSFARTRNNMFGMRAYDSNPNAATTYQTPEQSMRDYAELITSSPRYSRALQYRNNPYKFVEEVKNAGYATDPNYVQKVTSLPEFKQLAGG